MKKNLQTKDCGHEYMAPSCDVMELGVDHNVMIGTSPVTEEPEQDW